MSENPIMKPAEVIFQSSSRQHNSFAGSQGEWDFFNMPLIIELVPLIVGSGELTEVKLEFRESKWPLVRLKWFQKEYCKCLGISMS